jgi:hypothetical protein
MNDKNLKIEIINNNINLQGLTFKLIIIGEPCKYILIHRLRKIKSHTSGNR